MLSFYRYQCFLSHIPLNKKNHFRLYKKLVVLLCDSAKVDLYFSRLFDCAKIKIFFFVKAKSTSC